jgi:toxin YoeB
MLELFESEEAQADKKKIRKSYPKATQNRLARMVKEMLKTPFEGIGKPEPLRYNLAGFWSRRLTEKERVVYYVDDNMLNIVRYLSHYGDK